MLLAVMLAGNAFAQSIFAESNYSDSQYSALVEPIAVVETEFATGVPSPDGQTETGALYFKRSHFA